MGWTHMLTHELVTLIQKPSSRWLAVGRALEDAIAREAWKAEGEPSTHSWLDRIAGLSGRSTTYLSRCVSAARYLTSLKQTGLQFDETILATRSLSAIEELRRHTANDTQAAVALLPKVQSGQLKYHDFRLMIAKEREPRRRSERNWFVKSVQAALPDLLPAFGCSTNALIFLEPQTSLGTPDAVVLDPESGFTTLVEIKSALTARSLPGIVQQLLAFAFLGNAVWLILPADSDFPAEKVIESFRSAAVRNVGIALFKTYPLMIEKIHQIDAVASPSDSRTAFRNLITAPSGRRMAAKRPLMSQSLD